MDHDVRVLDARMTAHFENVNKRLDDQRTLQMQMHAENQTRFSAIEDKQDFTNGKVISHGEKIRTLFERLRDLARQRGGGAHADGEGEDRHVTLREVGIWVAIVGVTVGATIWFVVTVLHWGPKP